MFLTDKEILELIDNGAVQTPIPRLANPYGALSQIQPCSLDLTIGKIYLPGAEARGSGSLEAPKLAEHVLLPGQTAVVETNEIFKLPSTIAGFGFPPSHVSTNGLLMTNPGHIDPDYEGRLSFTLVNMGRTPYPLISGHSICTVLLFQLGQAPERNYHERGQPASGVQKDVLARLSPDFLDIGERANRAARSAVEKAATRERWLGIATPAITAIAVLISGLFTVWGLKGEIEVVRSQVAVAPLTEQIRVLDSRLKITEAPLGDQMKELDARLRKIEESLQQR